LSHAFSGHCLQPDNRSDAWMHVNVPDVGAKIPVTFHFLTDLIDRHFLIALNISDGFQSIE
jgi:hypothetical protein